MKIAIIIPYFGALPRHFQIFLDSCKYNPSFDWLIFSNDVTGFDYPPNVHFIEMTFAECRELVQGKFDFPVSLERPTKLCDFRPAYGYIFEEYLKGYDFWGHGDCDVVLGDLGRFITDEALRQYDKIFSMGHLTLYRNTEDNNRVFMSEIDGRKRYIEVFSTVDGCVFDEWAPVNINEIYLNCGRPVKWQNDCADLDAYNTAFARIFYDMENRRFRLDDVKNSIFLWEPGHLYQLYEDGGDVKQREYAYVHLFKRKMTDKRGGSGTAFYIVPNKFVDATADPAKLLKCCRKWQVLNTQYFKVKASSLKYRFKRGNWENVAFFSKLK